MRVVFHLLSGTRKPYRQTWGNQSGSVYTEHMSCIPTTLELYCISLFQPFIDTRHLPTFAERSNTREALSALLNTRGWKRLIWSAREGTSVVPPTESSTLVDMSRMHRARAFPRCLPIAESSYSCPKMATVQQCSSPRPNCPFTEYRLCVCLARRLCLLAYMS